MRIIYYVAGGLLLFIIRQVAVPFWGGLADLFLIVPPVFIWLWHEEEKAWWILITSSVLVDFMLVRILPFYTLTSLTVLAVCYFVIVPYFSHGTVYTRLLTIALWLVLWRLIYLTWLLWGWFIGGTPLDLDQSLLWWSLVWFIGGLTLVFLGLGLKLLVGRFSKRLSH